MFMCEEYLCVYMVICTAAVVSIGEDNKDDTYLSIIAGGPASDLAAAQPDPRYVLS